MPPKKKKVAPVPKKQPSPEPSTSGIRHSTPLYRHGRRPFEDTSSSGTSEEMQEPTPKRVAKERVTPQRTSPRLSQSLQKQKQPSGTRPSTSRSSPSFQKGRQSSSSNLDESSSNARKSNPIKNTNKADPKPGTSKETDASTIKKKKKRQVEYVTFANKTFKVSTKIAAEVKELRRTTHNLIPKLPFSRLTKEILMACGFTREHRITGEALDALQTSSEMHIVEVFEDAMLLAMHARRITCMPTDIALVRELRRKRGSM